MIKSTAASLRIEHKVPTELKKVFAVQNDYFKVFITMNSTAMNVLAHIHMYACLRIHT